MTNIPTIITLLSSSAGAIIQEGFRREAAKRGISEEALFEEHVLKSFDHIKARIPSLDMAQHRALTRKVLGLPPETVAEPEKAPEPETATKSEEPEPTRVEVSQTVHNILMKALAEAGIDTSGFPESEQPEEEDNPLSVTFGFENDDKSKPVLVVDCRMPDLEDRDNTPRKVFVNGACYNLDPQYAEVLDISIRLGDEAMKAFTTLADHVQSCQKTTVEEALTCALFDPPAEVMEQLDRLAQEGLVTFLDPRTEDVTYKIGLTRYALKLFPAILAEV